MQADAEQTINQPVIRFQAAALAFPHAPSTLDHDDPLAKVESSIDLLLHQYDGHVSRFGQDRDRRHDLVTDHRRQPFERFI